ncbi:hypothetical protein B0H67DRAFT_638222 [Lasiosphaeris hirsuta]|uniref:Uncharacterized protein n=1 Tax=Lasiosphaeris hirsuta TaxID=260670 RepID=A0AA40B8K3_9PEZI|nr:hypothetical protein B0H67DRAFT_638222 [Lasiosphaeris hirsuta]
MEANEMPFGVQDELSELSLNANFSLEAASGHRRRLKNLIAEIEGDSKVPIFVPLTGDYRDSKFAVNTMTRRDNEFVGALMEAVTQGRTELVLSCLTLKCEEPSEWHASVAYSELNAVLLHEDSLTYHSNLWYLMGGEVREQAFLTSKNRDEVPKRVWRRYAVILFPVRTLAESLNLTSTMPWHQSALQIFNSAFDDAEAGEKGARSILRNIISGLEVPLGPELQEQVLEWSIKLEDMKLVKKAVSLVPYTNFLVDPCVSSLASILNRENILADDCIDWAKWLGPFAAAIPKVANLFVFFHNIGRALDGEERTESFQEWRATVFEHRILNATKLFIRDIHPVMDVLTTYADEEGWIADKLFPKLVQLSSSGLQLFVLRAIDAGAGSPELLEKCFEKLDNKDLDCFALAPSHLAHDCMDRDEDAQHHSSKLIPLQITTRAGLMEIPAADKSRPHSRFVAALQRTSKMPLRYSYIICASRANMESRRMQHRAFVLDVDETRDLLEKLQENFELGDDMKALVRAIFKRLEASKPQKPIRPADGKWVKPELPDCCGGNPCAIRHKLCHFLASDDCGPLRLTDSEADHVLDAVCGCNYLRMGAEEEEEERGDGTIKSIVVIKTLDDYLHAVQTYNDDIAGFRRKLASLRTDWIRDALQERYDEAILLKNTRSRAASEENHARKLAADDRERMAALSEVTFWYRQHPCYGATVRADVGIATDVYDPDEACPLTATPRLIQRTPEKNATPGGSAAKTPETLATGGRRSKRKILGQDPFSTPFSQGTGEDI